MNGTAKVSKKLDRLVIRSPCAESWEAMAAGGSGRFCLRCHQHVHDLAALEAREIEALIQATRGRFCARMTRDAAGRLVTRPPSLPLPPPVPARRASPVAAAVVSALLGVAGAAWAEAPLAATGAATTGLAATGASGPQAPSAPADRAATGAILAGEVRDEQGPLPGVTVVARPTGGGAERTTVTAGRGTFLFEDLPAGSYRLEAYLEGFVFTPPVLHLAAGERQQATLTGEALVGPIILGGTRPAWLHELVRDSDLVVIATAGATRDGQGEDDQDRTGFQVTAVLNGTPRSRSLTVEHAGTGGDAEGTLQAGDTVLAFLAQPEGSVYSEHSYHGVRRLTAEALRSYRRRIEALTALGSAPYPADRAEWLVATVEDVHTRGEAVGPLRVAVWELAVLAASGPDREGAVEQALAADEGLFDSALVGGALTSRQQDRLARALLAADRLTEANLDLFELVRPHAGEPAVRWLAQALRTAEAGPDIALRRALDLYAEAIGAADLGAMVAAAQQGVNELLNHIPYESWDEAVWARFDTEAAAMDRDLQKRFLNALDSRP
jgi:hypothetical protein